MSITTIELYDALLLAGVDEGAARKAAKSVMSCEEARDVLLTRPDLEKALRAQTMWIAGMFVGQVAVFTALLALFL